jgi:predicted phosphohydrolase
MEVFGPAWQGYAEKIASHWKRLVAPTDLVLIPGDISWAMRLPEVGPDLAWIDALPGEKILLKGNHDYWWSSSSKLSQIMPPSIRFIHNNTLTWNGIALGGARLWDTPEYSFNTFITFRENPLAKKKTPEELSREKEEEEKIFKRELERLKLSLSQLDPQAQLRIALTHYPPIGADLKPSRASQLLEEFQIDICVFGHLHNVKPHSLPFGKARGVNYLFASCDYHDFQPILVHTCP